MRNILFVLLLFSCTPADTAPDDSDLQQRLCVKKILDFIPSVQPLVNEGCNTTWDNLSAIIENGEITYFRDLPAYTQNPNDIDKDRFLFVYQVKNPWYGIYENETPYSMIQSGWSLLPIDDYGVLTCQGIQELRIWVLDELTDRWYMNSQVVWAGYLCNGQSECSGYEFSDIEYTPYEEGFLHLMEGSITENNIE